MNSGYPLFTCYMNSGDRGEEEEERKGEEG